MKKFFSKFITKKSDWYAIPNLLVYFRMLLIPVFCIIYFQKIVVNGIQIQHWIAAGIVLLAGLTDFLDGQIARRCNMVTELGKGIDPLADKLMQFAIGVCIAIEYHSYWTIFLMLGIFVAKEVTLFVLDLICFNKNKKLNGALWFGKVSTFVFYVVMGVLLCLSEKNGLVIYISTSIAAFFLLVAYILYFPVFYKLYHSTETNVNDYGYGKYTKQIEEEQRRKAEEAAKANGGKIEEDKEEKAQTIEAKQKEGK